ncbi:unnamed protein product, partial [marine sediment metagenome]
YKIVRDCAERAGLGELVNPETGKVHHISPHKLRDAFAVMAVRVDDSGDGLRLLQEHLGHTSFNTTAKYRKISGQESKEWYGKLWEDKDKPGCSERPEKATLAGSNSYYHCPISPFLGDTPCS